MYFLGLSAAFLPEVTNPAIVPLNVSFLGDQYPSECPLWVWESFKWIFGGSAQQNGLSHPCANLLFSPSLKKKKNRIDFKKFRVSHASWEGGKENAGCSKKKEKIKVLMCSFEVSHLPIYSGRRAVARVE